MKAAAALLAFCLWVNSANIHDAAAKCGAPLMSFSSRVVGGTEAAHGSHPWLVSLQKSGSHFCGGAVIAERWIMTSAHWLFLLITFLSRVRVVVGEFDVRVQDTEEQVLPIKFVFVHENYTHAVPMNYDIALVELDQHIVMGAHVQPICLPLPDYNVPPQTSCIVGGWGRIKERGRLPSVLREVHLDLLDAALCKYVLQTVRGSTSFQDQLSMTVMCAGPDWGGRDACQGDSGGPLVCPAGSESGHWVVAGIASWGKGCGRSWRNNHSRPPFKRGSPGIFTDVRLFLPWIKGKLRDAEQQQQGRTSLGLCSVNDGSVSDEEGVIRNPAVPGNRYENNQLCSWHVIAPPGFSIVLEFGSFDLENDSHCHHDRLNLFVGIRKPVAILCGSSVLSLVLLNNSQNAELLFSSDISRAGSGFVIRHHAVRGHFHPGCGAVILVKDQSSIHTPNYPQPYSNACVVHWVIHAPQHHVVKLDFADFDVEESRTCGYDSLTVMGDVGGTEEIAVLCGSSVPPPVLSYRDVMVLHFLSDSSVSHRGFRAALTFISITDLQDGDTTEGSA